MTNEELVARIQGGDAGRMADLLEQNSGLLHAFARRYAGSMKNDPALSVEDLTQAAALGMMTAAAGYDPEKGMSFATWARYFMTREVRGALGIRTTKWRPECHGCARLDEPAPGHEGDDVTRCGLLADDAAADPQEEAEREEVRRVVRGEIAALPPDERAVLVGRALRGRPWETLSQEENKPVDALRRTEARALQSLRRNKRLLWLWREYESACHIHVGAGTFATTWTSATECAVLRRERLRAEMEEVSAGPSHGEGACGSSNAQLLSLSR